MMRIRPKEDVDHTKKQLLNDKFNKYKQGQGVSVSDFNQTNSYLQMSDILIFCSQFHNNYNCTTK